MITFIDCIRVTGSRFCVCTAAGCAMPKPRFVTKQHREFYKNLFIVRNVLQHVV